MLGQLFIIIILQNATVFVKFMKILSREKRTSKVLTFEYMQHDDHGSSHGFIHDVLEITRKFTTCSKPAEVNKERRLS